MKAFQFTELSMYQLTNYVPVNYLCTS